MDETGLRNRKPTIFWHKRNKALQKLIITDNSIPQAGNKLVIKLKDQLLAQTLLGLNTQIRVGEILFLLRKNTASKIYIYN